MSDSDFQVLKSAVNLSKSEGGSPFVGLLFKSLVKIYRSLDFKGQRAFAAKIKDSDIRNQSLQLINAFEQDAEAGKEVLVQLYDDLSLFNVEQRYQSVNDLRAILADNWESGKVIEGEDLVNFADLQRAMASFYRSVG